MLEKKYDLAADAYKNALRNNPKDEETRYNYALAKRKNKDNPPPKDNKKDLEDIPKELRDDLEFKFADTIDDVLKVALRDPLNNGHTNKLKPIKKKRNNILKRAR